MSGIIEKVDHLFGKTEVFFISSVDEHGFPNTKAMLAPRKREGVKYIYFTTALTSEKAIQYKANPKADLYFCDSQNFSGVMLLGKMEVLLDSNLKKELWREGDTLYHPLGVTDPDYCVLRFTTESGRYYSNLSSESFHLD